MCQHFNLIVLTWSLMSCNGLTQTQTHRTNMNQHIWSHLHRKEISPVLASFTFICFQLPWTNSSQQGRRKLCGAAWCRSVLLRDRLQVLAMHTILREIVHQPAPTIAWDIHPSQLRMFFHHSVHLVTGASVVLGQFIILWRKSLCKWTHKYNA